MEFEGKNYEYPPHEISIGHAEEEKEIKGRRGKGLVAQILTGKTQTKTGIFRGLEFKPNQTYNLRIFLYRTSEAPLKLLHVYYNLTIYVLRTNR